VSTENEATRTSDPPRISASCRYLDLHLRALHLRIAIQYADLLPVQIIRGGRGGGRGGGVGGDHHNGPWWPWRVQRRWCW
jgi:hypothetical protein